MKPENEGNLNNRQKATRKYIAKKKTKGMIKTTGRPEIEAISNFTLVSWGWELLKVPLPELSGMGLRRELSGG